MLILDTNHLRELLISGPVSERLKRKLMLDVRRVGTTIINVHEGIKGWIEDINRSPTALGKVNGYAKLHELLDFYSSWDILPFDARCAAQFDALKSIPALRRVPTMDLQIASIVLCNNATLLTRNLSDFQNVPNLKVEDWTIDDLHENADQQP